ncbi:MAG TPA: ASKHA domain-containing protein [Geomonas sp.]|nr:ASKHA domain-containing protein [Geomonas sp.]
MVNIHFLPDHRPISVPRGTTILEAARLAGITIESPCNGAVVCGKCAVHLSAGSLQHVREKGKHLLTRQERLRGQVLACAAEVYGDIAVEVPSFQPEQELKITSHGESVAVALAPYIAKEYSAERGVTEVYGGASLLAEEEGDTSAEAFGVVVDIGTTTLVASLVDLTLGTELATASALNPQSRHAQDVLSRIKIGSEPRGLEELRAGVIGEIGRLIDQVTGRAGVSRERIYEIIFSGNTCMLHLAAGVDPAPLGRYPYTPALSCASWLDAASVGLSIAPVGLVYLPPIISAYIGADITAGLQAVRLHEEKESVLFVDIGTNGEMALVHGGRLWATSTAAGPAFEGMNIQFGMRAGEGAIERFAVLKDGNVQLKTIDGSEPVGICGSGLMDVVAELVVHGVIAKNGKLVKANAPQLTRDLSERLVEKDGKPVFLLSEEVWLTQKDVRQVQLAKGAIRAGVEFLLREAGVTAASLHKVLIAGSFGFHLTAASLTAIGLLPQETAGRIEFVGNTAKSGGQAFLINRDTRREMSDLVRDIAVVELANCRDFDKVFVESLAF